MSRASPCRLRRGDATLQTVHIPLSPIRQSAVAAPGDAISAHELQIPGSALRQFERGRKLLSEGKNLDESIVAFRQAIGVPKLRGRVFLYGACAAPVEKRGRGRKFSAKVAVARPAADCPLLSVGPAAVRPEPSRRVRKATARRHEARPSRLALAV